jgi:hypothetical protein
VSLSEPTANDLAILVTAEDLARFRPDHPIDPGRIRASMVRVAGVRLVTYEYEPADSLYLSAEASIGPDGSGAEHAKRSLRGLKLGAWFQGDELELEEQEAPIRWGLETRFFQFRSGGRPVGNAFIAHSEQRGLFLMFAGVYFSDHGQFASFIRPKLDALESYGTAAP